VNGVCPLPQRCYLYFCTFLPDGKLFLCRPSRVPGACFFSIACSCILFCPPLFLFFSRLLPPPFVLLSFSPPVFSSFFLCLRFFLSFFLLFVPFPHNEKFARLFLPFSCTGKSVFGPLILPSSLSPYFPSSPSPFVMTTVFPLTR